MTILRVVEFIFTLTLLFVGLTTLSFAMMGYLCNQHSLGVLILAIVNAVIISGYMCYYLIRLTKELTNIGKKEE